MALVWGPHFEKCWCWTRTPGLRSQVTQGCWASVPLSKEWGHTAPTKPVLTFKKERSKIENQAYPFLFFGGIFFHAVQRMAGRMIISTTSSVCWVTWLPQSRTSLCVEELNGLLPPTSIYRQVTLGKSFTPLEGLFCSHPPRRCCPQRHLHWRFLSSSLRRSRYWRLGLLFISFDGETGMLQHSG